MGISEQVWNLAAFLLYSGITFRDLVYQSFQKGLLHLLHKLCFLTWSALLLTYIYFFLKLTSNMRRSFFDKLYLLSLSLTAVVALSYWSFYSIDPKLVDTTEYDGWDLEWTMTLFTHCGSLLIVICEGCFRWPCFRSPAFWWFLKAEVGFLCLYYCLQWCYKAIAGQAVYAFLEKITWSEVLLCYLLIGGVSLTIKVAATLVLSSRPFASKDKSLV